MTTNRQIWHPTCRTDESMGTKAGGGKVTWGNPRYCREDALWAQPFERRDLRWRRVRLGASVGSERFQRLRSLGSLHASLEFIPVFLPLFVVLSVNHTPTHLFTRLMVSFYSPVLSLWALFEVHPEVSVPQSHNLLWWLAAWSECAPLFVRGHRLDGYIKSHDSDRIISLRVWITKLWCATGVCKSLCTGRR